MLFHCSGAMSSGDVFWVGARKVVHRWSVGAAVLGDDVVGVLVGDFVFGDAVGCTVAEFTVVGESVGRCVGLGANVNAFAPYLFISSQMMNV